MIDHAAVNVTDLEAGKRFYGEALKPLGYSLLFEMGDFLGFGENEMPNFGVVRRDPVGGGHVAFSASDRGSVDAFYEAAVAAGGQDNGPRASVRTTTRTTTRPMSTTPTATTSRRSATRPPDGSATSRTPGRHGEPGPRDGRPVS
jgi:catechol 2,3-dioxygenase-like lactoylglutathione lyase family enzyme